MTDESKASRLLGAAFLFVLVASATSTALYTSIAGSGTISETLLSIAESASLVRASVLLGLLTSAGIVVLAVMFYVVMKKQDRVLALVGLGLWLAEAVTLAMAKVGALALIPLSADFVEAGAPDASHFQTLGDFLHNGLMLQGDDVHMVFYSLGGVLWFYLLYKSQFIPRFLAVCGLVIETWGLIGMTILFATAEMYGFFFYPIAVLELVVGLWLVIKGIEDGSETGPSAA